MGVRPTAAVILALTAGLSIVLTVGAPESPDTERHHARELTQALDSDTARERDAAARDLRAMGQVAEVALREAVRTGSPAVRRRATSGTE